MKIGNNKESPIEKDFCHKGLPKMSIMYLNDKIDRIRETQCKYIPITNVIAKLSKMSLYSYAAAVPN